MTEDEEKWYWFGLSHGLATAEVIVRDSRKFEREALIVEIKTQRQRIDNRKNETAAELGALEYGSWIQGLAGDLEAASWETEAAFWRGDPSPPSKKQ